MTTDPPDLSMPASLRRRLPTLGHGLHQLREAWRVLGVRLERGLLDEDTMAWIERWKGAAQLDLTGEASLAWAGKAWRVTGLGGDELDPDWLRVLMLLHLPALRSYWRRALRSQRFAWMAQALPKVWALDQTPLKPGAVIFGLGIPAWENLPRLLDQGWRFAVVDPADGATREVRAATWPAVLLEAGEKPLLLVERFAAEPEGVTNAFWHWDGYSKILPGPAPAA